ncbi:5054_t:CDS:2, partial [Paraglomus occultum]
VMFAISYLFNADEILICRSHIVSTSKASEEQSHSTLHPHLNYKHFRSNVDKIAQNIRDRAIHDADIYKVVNLYDKVRILRAEVKDINRMRNDVQKQAQVAKAERHSALVERGRELKEQAQAKGMELDKLETELVLEGSKIPNDTHPDVPVGGESKAHIIKEQGIPIDRTTHSFEIKDHMSLSRSLDLIDLESAANVTGSSWYYLRNAGALLELALIQYTMLKVTNKGFTPIITPDVVRAEYSYACGFQPRSHEASQNYFVTSGRPSPSGQSPRLMLAATAEVPLAGMYSNRLLSESQLPIKMVGFGRAFRAEAGARGADTKGLYRVHQFSKVELFALTTPHESEAIHEEIRLIQEEIFEELGLCYRTLDMPTEELGASAYRKYDIEAWMPGRDGWGEISSASNCTDYQSRRLNIRYRPTSSHGGDIHAEDGRQQKTTEYVHTLNGTALAVPRVIIAILENFQTREGKVHIPEVLVPWMGGSKVIP